MASAALLKEVQTHLAEVAKNSDLPLDKGLLDKYDLCLTGK